MFLPDPDAEPQGFPVLLVCPSCDAERLRVFFERRLNDARITSVHSLEEACARLAEQRFDLVVARDPDEQAALSFLDEVARLAPSAVRVLVPTENREPRPAGSEGIHVLRMPPS